MTTVIRDIKLTFDPIIEERSEKELLWSGNISHSFIESENMPDYMIEAITKMFYEIYGEDTRIEIGDKSNA